MVFSTRICITIAAFCILVLTPSSRAGISFVEYYDSGCRSVARSGGYNWTSSADCHPSPYTPSVILECTSNATTTDWSFQEWVSGGTCAGIPSRTTNMTGPVGACNVAVRTANGGSSKKWVIANCNFTFAPLDPPSLYPLPSSV